MSTNDPVVFTESDCVTKYSKALQLILSFLAFEDVYVSGESLTCSKLAARLFDRYEELVKEFLDIKSVTKNKRVENKRDLVLKEMKYYDKHNPSSNGDFGGFKFTYNQLMSITTNNLISADALLNKGMHFKFIIFII